MLTMMSSAIERQERDIVFVSNHEPTSVVEDAASEGSPTADAAAGLTDVVIEDEEEAPAEELREGSVDDEKEVLASVRSAQEDDTAAQVAAGTKGESSDSSSSTMSPFS